MIKLEQSQIDALIEYHKREILDIEKKIRTLEMFRSGVIEVADGVNVSLSPVLQMFNARKMVMEMFGREGKFLTTRDFVREAIGKHGQKASVEFTRQMSNVLAAMKVAGKVVNYDVDGRRERYWGLPEWVDAKGKALTRYKPE